MSGEKTLNVREGSMRKLICPRSAQAHAQARARTLIYYVHDHFLKNHCVISLHAEEIIILLHSVKRCLRKSRERDNQDPRKPIGSRHERTGNKHLTRNIIINKAFAPQSTNLFCIVAVCLGVLGKRIICYRSVIAPFTRKGSSSLGYVCTCVAQWFAYSNECDQALVNLCLAVATWPISSSSQGKKYYFLPHGCCSDL